MQNKKKRKNNGKVVAKKKNEEFHVVIRTINLQTKKNKKKNTKYIYL
jgi:hypothetical protein